LSLLKKYGPQQLGLFDEKELADVDIDNRRLVVCRNPLAGADTKRRREELLIKIDEKLKVIKERVWDKTSIPTKEEKTARKKRRRLVSQAAIQKAVDKIFSIYPLEKFYTIEIAGDYFSFKKNEEEIKLAAKLDGVYVLETTITRSEMTGTQIQENYKLLKFVEYGWRRMKGNLEIRPVFHYKEKRIKGHVFICFLAFLVEQELFHRWKESGLKKEIEWDETIFKIKQWSKTRVTNNPTLKAIDSNFTPELAHILSRLRIPL
jgi:transposase